MNFRVSQRCTLYSVQQSAETYLAAEEVLREMYIENKKFNLNSPIDKDFIEAYSPIACLLVGVRRGRR